MELPGQMTLFEVLEGYAAGLLPFEAAKKGRTAYIVQWRGVMNGDRKAEGIQYIQVRQRKIQFKRDSDRDKYGWNVYYDTIDGKDHMGKWGGRGTIFAGEPTREDMERYVRERTKNDPEYREKQIKEWNP